MSLLSALNYHTKAYIKLMNEGHKHQQTLTENRHSKKN